MLLCLVRETKIPDLFLFRNEEGWSERTGIWWPRPWWRRWRKVSERQWSCGRKGDDPKRTEGNISGKRWRQRR